MPPTGSGPVSRGLLEMSKTRRPRGRTDVTAAIENSVGGSRPDKSFDASVNDSSAMPRCSSEKKTEISWFSPQSTQLSSRTVFAETAKSVLKRCSGF